MTKKIYGLYPGSIKNVSEIDNLNEVDLYFAIDSMNGYIINCNKIMSYNHDINIDLTEEQYALEYMIYQTKKFGTDVSEPKEKQHIKTTDTYWKWFRFYDNYFKNELSKKDLKKFTKAKNTGKDVSKYLPKDKWNEEKINLNNSKRIWGNNYQETQSGIFNYHV